MLVPQESVSSHCSPVTRQNDAQSAINAEVRSLFAATCQTQPQTGTQLMNQYNKLEAARPYVDCSLLFTLCVGLHTDIQQRGAPQGILLM